MGKARGLVTNWVNTTDLVGVKSDSRIEESYSTNQNTQTTAENRN